MTSEGTAAFSPRLNVPDGAAGRLPQAHTDAAVLATRPTARIAAENDVQAVSLWLSEYRESPQTFRAYRKEAERLMLWLDTQNLSLGEVDRQALDSFERFLSDPQPASRWIGPPRARSHPQWRPFRRPLGAASRRQSLVILQGLFAWLVEAGWVAHNPFRLMRGKRRRLDNRHERVERYLERPLWDWLWQWLNRPLADTASRREWREWQRRRFLFGFGYLLAPRVSEMAQTRMNDFRRREGQWWWYVTGKGGKQARIPVPPDMLALLGDWRQSLGLPAEPDIEEDEPVLRTLGGDRGLGDNQLYRLIKTAFRDASRDLAGAGVAEGRSSRRYLIAQLEKATPHWLRHTAITHQAQAGVELRYLARTARHSRLDTTARYLHTEAEEWQHQIAEHRLNASFSLGGQEPVADEEGGEPL